MATSSSRDKDAVVLDSIIRLGIGVRELLLHALGADPNNIIARLLEKGLISSVARGLPQNRAYYLPKGERALGSQALHQRLGLAWYVLVESESSTVKVTEAELHGLFGAEAPPGPHLLQARPGGDARLLHVYMPETVAVLPGIVRHLERARTIPAVAEAIEDRSYAFLVLVPWGSTLEGKLESALRVEGTDEEAPGPAGLPYVEWRRLRDLAKQAHLVVGRVATPSTLSLALKETEGRV